MRDSTGNLVFRNVSHDNEDSGINVWTGTANGQNTFYDNVTYANGDHGIDVHNAVDAHVIANTVFGNFDSGIESTTSTRTYLANNVSVDNGINSPRTSGNIRIDAGSVGTAILNDDLVCLARRGRHDRLERHAVPVARRVPDRDRPGVARHRGRPEVPELGHRRLPPPRRFPRHRRRELRAIGQPSHATSTATDASTTRPPRTPASVRSPSPIAARSSSAPDGRPPHPPRRPPAVRTLRAVITVDDFAAEARRVARRPPWRRAPRLRPDPAVAPGRRRAGRGRRRCTTPGSPGIHWPIEFGGRGLTVEHTAAWTTACAQAEVPPFLNMVGLRAHRRRAARVRHARSSSASTSSRSSPARGCGASCSPSPTPAPTSRRCRPAPSATATGWVVTGQKVWCSNGRVADRGILLARTDPDAAPHRGISFFLLDMHAPGRRDPAAAADERRRRVRRGVPRRGGAARADALLGPEHAGWMVAMSALTNERGYIGGAGRRPATPARRDARRWATTSTRSVARSSPSSGPAAPRCGRWAGGRVRSRAC